MADDAAVQRELQAARERAKAGEAARVAQERSEARAQAARESAERAAATREANRVAREQAARERNGQ